MDAKLRRLIDLPGIKDLEYKALMKPALAEPEARAEVPEIDACSMALFGLTADEAEAAERPGGWDWIENRPVRDQLDAFEAEGWDLTDDRRKPLRTFGHFNQQLWLALRGLAGHLPASAHAAPKEEKQEAAWGSNLAADAARFRRERR